MSCFVFSALLLVFLPLKLPDCTLAIAYGTLPIITLNAKPERMFQHIEKKALALKFPNFSANTFPAPVSQFGTRSSVQFLVLTAPALAFAPKLHFFPKQH
jgi:hypothetical protein